jgi:hypothetical protein
LTVVSALVPTIDGREHWLEQFERSVDAAGGDVEIVVVRNAPNWGVGINEAAEQAEGDYFFMGSDDHEVWPGWWEAAAKVCDAGMLPAPLMLNTDGTWQSAGDYDPDFQEDGDTTLFPRVPFCSRKQWDLLGPLLPIHYSDVYFGTNAKEVHGIDSVVCYGYKLTHHFAPEGRFLHEQQERIRIRTERKLARS